MSQDNFFERPKVVKTVVRIILAIAVLSVLAEFFIHKHGHFDFEHLPVMHGFLGFFSYCCIVLGAKALRPLLRRDEDYYDES